MTENEVIAHVTQYLEMIGFTIEQSLSTDQRGIDIIASHETGVRCLVEAKGGTSSKADSNRYGKPFSRNQVRTHISVALLKCLQLKEQFDDDTIICIALPDDRIHKEILETIKTSVNELGISTLLVDQKGAMNVESPNGLLSK